MLYFPTANQPLRATSYCMANFETPQKTVNVTLIKSLNSSLSFEEIEDDIFNCRANINCGNGYQSKV